MRAADQVPGLADLYKAVAVRVENVGAGHHAVWFAHRRQRRLPPIYTLAVRGLNERAESLAVSRAATVNSSATTISLPERESIADPVIPVPRPGQSSPAGPRAPQRRFQCSKTRERLTEDAQQYFSQHTLPARPELSRLSGQTQPEPFLRAVSESRLAGLVIGEAHSAQTSKAFLIKHMKQLKALKFDTLYVRTFAHRPAPGRAGCLPPIRTPFARAQGLPQTPGCRDTCHSTVAPTPTSK